MPALDSLCTLTLQAWEQAGLVEDWSEQGKDDFVALGALKLTRLVLNFLCLLPKY